MDTPTERALVEQVTSLRTLEGGGFPVRRPFPTAQLGQIDPFLLIDEMGPVDWPPGGAIGAPDHPHRGFETITYVLQGRNRHKDSHGHSGALGPGDVQWMTAGGGVVHSELPDPEFKRNGGVMHGFQIWVNLPARDKFMTPRYQELRAESIPEATSPDGGVHVRVIAGEALGVRAMTETRTPIMLLHFTLQPGASLAQPVPLHHIALAYVFRNEALLGPRAALAREGALGRFGAGVLARFGAPVDGKAPTELLLLTGEPINEPIVRYGPFVMNTRQEILDAFRDYEEGRMGTIAPDVSTH